MLINNQGNYLNKSDTEVELEILFSVLMNF